MPFVTFSLAHCLWSPTQSGRGIVISRLNSMSFLLLGTLNYYWYVSLAIKFHLYVLSLYDYALYYLLSSQLSMEYVLHKLVGVSLSRD